jgi:hypothetical protein
LLRVRQRRVETSAYEYEEPKPLDKKLKVMSSADKHPLKLEAKTSLQERFLTIEEKEELKVKFWRFGFYVWLRSQSP